MAEFVEVVELIESLRGEILVKKMAIVEAIKLLRDSDPFEGKDKIMDVLLDGL